MSLSVSSVTSTAAQVQLVFTVRCDLRQWDEIEIKAKPAVANMKFLQHEESHTDWEGIWNLIPPCRPLIWHHMNMSFPFRDIPAAPAYVTTLSSHLVGTTLVLPNNISLRPLFHLQAEILFTDIITCCSSLFHHQVTAFTDYIKQRWRDTYNMIQTGQKKVGDAS